MSNIVRVEGLDELIADMEREGATVDARGERVLLAAAEVFKQGYKQAAHENHFHRTGGLIASMGFSSKVKRARDILSVDVYPQGTNPKGQRYAEIAYILHWGTTSTAAQKRHNESKKYRNTPGIPRTLWVDRAEAIANETVVEAMRKAWEEETTP